MRTRFKQWLKAPSFEDDPEMTGQAGIANALILYLGLALLIVIVVLIPLFAVQKFGSWIIAIAVLCGLGVGRHFIFKGNFRLGATLIFSIIYLCILVMLVLSGGSSSTAMFYFATIVLIAGYFLEARVVNGFTVATFLIAMGISFLQERGLVSIPKVFVFNSVFSWIATGLGLLFMIRTRDLFVGNLKNALSLSRQENKARQDAEQTLRESEEKFKAQYKGTPIPIFTWQVHGDDLILADYNDAGFEFTKGNIANLLGTTASSMYHDNPITFNELLACSREKVNWRIERWHRLASTGEEKFILCNYAFVPPDLVQVNIEDFTEHRRIEESLRESEEKYRGLLEGSPDAIVIYVDGRIVLANQASVALIRAHSVEDLLGRQVIELIHPDYRGFVLQRMRAAQERGENLPLAHEKFLCLDGSTVDVEVKATPITYEKKAAVQIIVRDITERKRAEEALRESEKRYRALFEQASDGIFYLDTDGNVVAVNESFARMHGYSVEEMQGMQLQDLDTPENAHQMPERMRRLMAGEIIEFEAEHFHKDGHVFPLAVSTGLIAFGGQQLIQAFHRDITERKRADAAIRESEERYKLMFDSAPFAINITSGTQITYANPSYLRMFGFASLAELQSLAPLALFTPAMRSQILENIQRRAKGLEVPDQYESECLHKDGSSFPVLMGFTRISFTDGPATVGFVLDITERKRAEEALRKSEERFRTIIESAPIGISIGRDGKLIYANSVYAHMHGFTSAAELIGSSTQERVAPQDQQRSLERSRQRAQGEFHEITPYELVGSRLDGTQIPMLAAVSRVDMADGPANIGFFQDITALKQAESALRESELAAQRSAAQLQMVNQISLKITAGLDLEHLMQTIFEQCQQIGDVDTFYIALVDDAAEILRFPFYYKDGEFRSIETRNIRENPGLSGYIIENRQTIYLPDTFDIPPGIGTIRQPGIHSRSFIGIPMILNERVIGILSMQSHALNAYMPEQIHTLELLATQVAIAIQNSQLFNQVQNELNEREHAEDAVNQRNAELAVLNQIGQALTKLANPSEILERVVAETGKIMDNRNMFIALYDMNTRYISFEVEFVNGVRQAPRGRYFADGVTEYIIQNKTPFLTLKHSVEERRRLGIAQLGTVSRCFIGVPIVTDDEVTGVITLQDYELENLYNEHHLELLTTIAAQTSIALKNARLYDAVQKELEERKRAEQAILEGEKKYRDLFDVNKDGIAIFIITPEERPGNFVELNTAAHSMLGYTRTEMLNLTPAQLEPEASPGQVRARQAELQSSGLVNFETKLLTKNGELISVEITAQVVHYEGRPAVMNITRDISERKRSEEAQSRLAAIVQSSQDAIIGRNLDGVITTWNPGAELLYGWSASEAIGQSITILNPPGQPDDLREIETRILQDEHIPHFETRRRTKDGRIVDISGSISPLKNAAGQIVGISSIARNVTEQKKAEAELLLYREHLEEIVRERTAELVIAKDLAESANRAKSDFLAIMSHEIRTPLNGVLGLAYLVQQTDLNEKQRDYLNRLQFSGETLMAIINDILNYSKIEAGKLIIERVDFYLEDVFHNLANLVAPRAREQGLELVFDINAKTPDLLTGDPLRLGQVLLNLVGNAIKFTQAGEIIVTAGLIEGKNQSPALEISVRDTGIGMTDAQIALLFQPFSQADTSTSRKYGGTGLGLTISQRLVKLMGGEIRAQSQPGVGSVFTFTVAVELSSAAAPECPAIAPEQAGLRVLVLDRHLANRQSLKNMLESFSFRVELTDSIETGLGLLSQAGEEPFGLVLINQDVPGGLDGREVARRIKQKIGLVSIPILLMAGTEEMRQQTGQEIFAGCLVKPITRSQLLEAIQQALGQAPATFSRSTGKKIPAETLEKLRGNQILVVEDNEINQMIAVDILETMGIQVAVANNGEQAVQMAGQNSYAAILMDIQMPGMDGYQATAQIRKLVPEVGRGGRQLPIIAMTAYALDGDSQKALEAGLNDYVSKPVDVMQLASVLLRWLDRPSDSVEIAAAPENKAPTAPPEKLDVLDLVSALARLDNNRGLYLRLAGMFHTEHAHDPQAIRAALQENNHELARRLAHTLKGLAGTLGADALREAARTLETAITEENTALYEPGLAQLEQKLAEVLRAIESMLENTGS